jgi:hypothetical protein
MLTEVLAARVSRLLANPVYVWRGTALPAYRKPLTGLRLSSDCDCRCKLPSTQINQQTSAQNAYSRDFHLPDLPLAAKLPVIESCNQIIRQGQAAKRKQEAKAVREWVEEMRKAGQARNFLSNMTARP